MQYHTLTVECDTIRVSIQLGSILFSSSPPGADIYLIASGGGPPVYIGLQTPNTIPDLPIGNYDYILKLTGFEDYIGTTTVNANDTTVVIVDLNPIPILTPLVATVGTASILGLLLLTTTRAAIPITTGILGGNIVTVKL